MQKFTELAEMAARIRRHSVAMIYHAGSGHPGGALSCADILAYLWSRELKYTPGEDENRDRFVLSKGHACPALYAAAVETGLIERELIFSLRKLDCLLQGHPHAGCLPWVEASSGSLGQGFSVAIGMAMGFNYLGKRVRTYVMLGDGELQEGEVWEGAMCAGHYKLNNLCGILDYNKMQSDDLNENIMGLEPLKAKWEAFNWHVLEIDGHNFLAIEEAVAEAKKIKGKPVMIIAHTVKGKGVKYMEGSPLWHGSVKLSKAQLEEALNDLETPGAEMEVYLNGRL